MADVAALGLSVDSSQVVKGASALDQLATSALNAESAADALSSSAGAAVSATAKLAPSSAAAASALQKQATAITSVGTALEGAASRAEDFTAKAAALRAGLDPIAASQAKLTAQVAEYKKMLDAAAISSEEFAKAEAMAKARHDQFVSSLNKTPVGGVNDNNAAFRRTNLGYQAFDVGQGLATGLSPGIIAAQQGPQILQAYMGPGGGLAAVKADAIAARSAIVGLAGQIPVVGWAFAGVTAAAGAFYLLAQSQTKTTDEILKEHAANIKGLGDAYDLAATKAQHYSDADKQIALAKAQSSATELRSQVPLGVADFIKQFSTPTVAQNGTSGAISYQLQSIYAPFQKAFDDLQAGGSPTKFIEDLKQIAGQNEGLKATAQYIIKMSEGITDAKEKLASGDIAIFLASWSNGFDAIAKSATKMKDAIFDAYRMVQAQDQRAAQLLNISAKTPDERADAARAQFKATPLAPDEIGHPDLRQYREDTAALLAKTQAEQQLKDAQDARVRSSKAAADEAQFELSIAGKSIAVQNQLRAAYEAKAKIEEANAAAHAANDPKEIAAAQAKAVAIAKINGELTAQKMLQSQMDQTEQLQLQANLIGASADAVARETAALQERQALLRAGADINSQIAKDDIARAEANASLAVQIQRQQAAFQSLQQAEGNAIDTLVGGLSDFSGSWKDTLKNTAQQALQWFNQMAIANPLKNALIPGSNLPTLMDLFSGKPQVPGATATTTPLMNVTASVVNMNGGLPGLPGFPTSNTPGATTTLGQFLGLGTNGVRPDVVNGQVVNSPVGAAANIAGMLPAAANQNTAVTPANMALYQQAISKIESGSFAGNYSALGPTLKNGDYAIGRYQIMASNVPQWSQQYLGQQITPQQLLANPAYQDAIFNGQFGGDVSKYGATGAASKWFTGSPFPSGKADVLGTTDNSYVQQFNANLATLGQTTSATSTNITTLGDSSKSLNSGFTNLFSTLGQTPTSSSSSSGGLFSWLGNLFGGTPTPSVGSGVAAGGTGPAAAPSIPAAPAAMASKQRVTVEVTASVDKNGNFKNYVKKVSQDTVDDRTPGHIAAYDREHLPARVRQISGDKWARG